MDAVRHKLAAARTRLALERPFLGALVLHLPLVPSTRCHTIATDARALYFNPAFVEALSFADTQFFLAHEALHCGLLHWHRGRRRLRERWDRACDYAVNQLLADDGMPLAEGVLVDRRFRGLAAEAIYAKLDDEPAGSRVDEHWFGANGEGAATVPGAATSSRGELVDDALLDAHADGFDEVMSRAPTASLAIEWQDRLARAALEAAYAGRLAAHWARVVADVGSPRLPWRTLLARFLMSIARDDFSFARPSRRDGAAILPGVASGELDLVLALDTSGSISRHDLADFAAEIDALKGQIRARVALLLCDAEVSPGSPWRFEPWEPIALPEEAVVGGGTRFTPVFDWIANEVREPDALLYFTDAQGEFPDRAPDFPVLWLVKGNAPIPWGERVQLD